MTPALADALAAVRAQEEAFRERWDAWTFDRKMRQPRVLVVDDMPEMGAVMKRILVDIGVEVDVAHTPEEAYALAAHHVYAVAIVDLMLEGATGMSVVERLRPGVILVSGLCGADREQARVDCRADLALGKPIDAEELRGAVLRMLPR